MHEPLDRRSFLAATSASLAGAAFAQGAQPELPTLTHGPFRCDTAPLRFDVWARASAPGEYELRVEDPATAGGDEHHSSIATALDEDDLTLRWSLPNLAGEVGAYTADVLFKGRSVWRGTDWHGGAPVLRKPNAHVVFGSCADERKFATQPTWTRMAAVQPDLVVLLGDTPYIDSTDVAVRRDRYRAFYAQPELAALLGKVPFVATWDDHDYATNDRFGDFEGRDDARRVFLEYHGPGAWGSHERGIYTRRRVGPIEVFLLDTRWFADTEPSHFDPARKTLLGSSQWRWLQSALETSDAPFKVLASGMIWNDAVRPLKRDYWGNWPHERDGLFRWLGEKNISGIVLVGGDIHRTRVVQHATKAIVGYDILELITSPIANTVIDSANAPHPGLVFDQGVEQSFLSLNATMATTFRFEARLLGGDGSILFKIERFAATLSRRD